MGLVMSGIFIITNSMGFMNIGWSIIIFTIVINLAMYPLTLQQQKSTKLMSVMQPELQAIQKKYKGKTDNDSMIRMQNESKAVYAKYGTSMTGGCVQMMIQLPILFALYKVILAIPAYVPIIKEIFTNIATPLMGSAGFSDKMAAFVADSAQKLSSVKYDPTSLNSVIDLMNKFSPKNWLALQQVFPDFANVIAVNSDKINNMNSFLGINLSVSPAASWSTSLAWLIPILAGLTQWYSAKLMSASQTAQPNGEENTMAAQMKSMNTVMPLMSVVFCFMLASGLGVYWVASAVCRIVQQVFINRKLGKMNVDDIVRQNLEKVNRKREKKGLKPQTLQDMNKTLQNAKQVQYREENSEQMKERKLSEIAKQVKDSTAYYNKNANPNSLAAKANMVAQFDARMDEKKHGKKKDSDSE